MGKAERRAAANIAFTFASRTTELLAGLLVVGMLSRHLGLEDFGRYSALTAIGWVALPLLSMGFPRILIREIAQHPESAAEHVQTGWSWNILTTGLLLAILLLASRRHDLASAGTLLAVSLAAGVTAGTQTAAAVSIALQRMHYETIPTLASMLSLLALTAAAVHWQLGLGSIFAAQALASLVGLALTVWLTSGLSPYLRKFVGIVQSLRKAKELLPESLLVGLSQLLVQLYLYLGVFLLKALAGNAETALFQGPFRIFNRVQIVPMALMPVLLPIFSRLFKEQDADALRRAAQSVFRGMLLVSLPLTFLSSALADQIAWLVLGPEFKASAQVFRILSLSFSFSFLNILSDALFIASKKTSALAWVQGAGALLCGLLNLLLIPWFASVGSSWATVAATCMMFVANCVVFRPVLKGLLAKAAMTALVGGTAGAWSATTSQELGMAPSLLLGSAMCAAGCLVLGIASVQDLRSMAEFARRRKVVHSECGISPEEQ